MAGFLRGRRRKVALGVGLAALTFVVYALVDAWRAFGARATGARRARMIASPEWSSPGVSSRWGGHFVNPQPLVNSAWGALTGAFAISPDVAPKGPVPVVKPDPRSFDTPPPSGLRVTWFGHSTILLEVDGHRFLTDPVWSSRVGPVGFAGPRPWFPPPLALGDVPHVDAVLISHDHYDHLDCETLTAMRGWETTFVVPLGVGAHLAYWGVPESHIVEVDWWTTVAFGDLTVTATPARHASGRMVVDDDAKLWAGYAFVGPRHRVYFSGDTGLFPALKQIGKRLGPFDLTMIEVGQYHSAWPDWHIGPEQAVLAHQWVGGRLMLPIHWGKLALAYHGWTEPVERALAAAQARGVSMVTPRIGQSFEPDTPPAVERWWPSLPWKTAVEDPIVSSRAMDPPP